MARSTPPQQTSADLAPVEPLFRVADDVREVARALIRRHPASFGFIDGHSFRITYLVRTDGPPEEAKIDTVAKCIKAPALWGFLAECDFAIWVNEWYWGNFPQHREAIVLHELLHVGVSDKGRPAISRHDVEEFIGVAAQYGAWELNRKRFGEALAKHRAEHPDPAIDELPAGGVVIDAGKVAELRNRVHDAREGKAQ